VRAMNAAEQLAEDLAKRVEYAKQSIENTPEAPDGLMTRAMALGEELDAILWTFNGQEPKASSEENWPAPVPLNDRLGALVYSHWNSTSRVSETQQEMYDILAEEFPPVLEKLKNIAEVDLKALEADLDAIGAPWTPGRIPEWEKE